MDQLRHLQLVILSIMKDVDELCRKNDIEYYLLGGSAIGAIRHKGFIPWDDDLDIMMTPKNYNRFIAVCRKQLDPNKYYIQEGLVDWPLNFTKIKLKGTYIEEYSGSKKKDDTSGIFLDVFKLENSPSGRWAQRKQYVLAKYYLCYQLSKRGFEGAGFKKAIMMTLAAPLNISCVRNLVVNQIEKYGDDSEYYGSFYFRTRMKNAFSPKKYFGKPMWVEFEDTRLPVPEHYHEYLTQMFGDYMTPPPVENRVGLHTLNVEFGKY